MMGLGLTATLAVAPQSFAADSDEMIEEVITIGTRGKPRSAVDSTVAVDVIPAAVISQNSSPDLQDMLRTAIPSFDVNTQPISDAATVIRPANLRGMSPDNVLVLVNGKRRHRGSVISFLGGGISDGAQGVDISAIPSLAIKQVEVLRDGASSQYGSDAIAGVINFVLKDSAEGGVLTANYGSTFEGDGDNYTIGGNIGLPLGNKGFVNLTAEIKDSEGTVRSVIRDDVAAYINAGYLTGDEFLEINTYTSEVPQYWGQPDVEDDVKVFINSAYELNDKAEAYMFANYGSRTATGGVFYRAPLANPVTGGGQRGGVYAGPSVDPLTGFASTAANAVPSILVGDIDGGTSCIDGIPQQTGSYLPDPAFLTAVTADPNCFSFLETIPNGFVPRFGGENIDSAISVGVRGELSYGTGLNYDLSATRGSNETEFFIKNTINASLGPNTPRDFIPGGQEQIETMLNADFAYAVNTGFASDLNIGFGTEYREEEFNLTAGDAASFALGPLASQGFSSSSNGYGGSPRDTSATQDSIAFYVDLEADVTDALTLQTAIRYEDFSEFGNTTDYKLAGLYRVSDTFRLRGAISTGFHAPTAGQASITNVTTQNVQGVLVDQGTLPLSSVAGQLAADFVESQGNGRPELGPEDAQNLSLGVAFDVGGATWTVDYYNIELTDRVALGADVDFLDALNLADNNVNNYTTVSAALTGLDADGVINRTQDFVGLDDLAQFRFFSNSFDTTTSGIDVVGRYGFDFRGGESDLTFVANYNKTEVDNRGTVNPISTGRVQALEELLPKLRGNISWAHKQNKFRTLLRANYYGGWNDTGNGVDNIDAEFLVDAEVAYQVNDKLEVIGGLANMFDVYPEENPGAGGSGQLYSEASPFGFNGAQWYLRARMTF